ncbi:MAG TPA: LacI family DNA-binding transcriptional regulator [Nocardioidaceae bacterium]|nr:LacI family DNA-binding transcriptional regulator [Nocardioidaceae bacterium]
MGDVAAHIGVSRQLVSLVMRSAPGPSAESRERVLGAAAELGYHPDTAAQMLRRGRSRHLGVLFTMRQPHDVALVDGIYPAAERLGYAVALGAIGPSRGEEKAVEELLGYRVEALILIGPYLAQEPLAELAEQLPIVQVGRRIGLPGVDSVRTADDRGAQQAIDHLVGLGHRDIVHVDGGTLPGATERRRGYRTAMRRHGLEEHVRVLPGDYTEESGARAARQLLQADNPPTAVLAGNDLCAHGFLDTLIRTGLNVPGDVSVVGYDDSPIAGLSFIDLTTVRQDAARMAELAVQAAAERLDDGRTAARDVVLDPALVIRGTTARPASTPLVRAAHARQATAD